jgi:hypothetical protein
MCSTDITQKPLCIFIPQHRLLEGRTTGMKNLKGTNLQQQAVNCLKMAKGG